MPREAPVTRAVLPERLAMMVSGCCRDVADAGEYRRSLHFRIRLCKLETILHRHGKTLELRHLRYFVAVAEAGSLTVAAEQTLHTAQPSLSRQIRDLEYQVGTPLMTRSARGIE